MNPSRTTKPVLQDDVRVMETPLFSQSWWLDAVAPDGWDEVCVNRGDETVARMRFGVRHVVGLGTIIRMPRATPYLGPELFVRERTGARGIGEHHALIEELVDALPGAASVDITCHPNIDSWLPFHWKGFNQTTRYTHRLTDLQDPDRLWNEFSSSTRRAIRKAEKRLEIRVCEDSKELARLHACTFTHQGTRSDLDAATLARLHTGITDNDGGEIVAAYDTDNRAHAAIMVVFNNAVAYYLVGGSDPAMRNSGAMSYLLWYQIQKQRERVKKFDFEGSMIPGIERFFRGFGAIPVPLHSVSKSKPSARFAQYSVNRFRSLSEKLKAPTSG